MSETIVEKFANFAIETEFKDLPEDVVKMTKTILLDTIGCAIGGSFGEISDCMREVIRALGGREESTIIGDGKTSSANATLANGCAARFLDFNDIYISHTRETVHASEAVIPVALALGESEHLSGKEIMTAIALGYDIYMRIADSPLKGFVQRGWNASGCSLGTAVTAGKLLGLSKDQLMNAMAINSPKIMMGYGQHFSGAVSWMKDLHGAWDGHDGIVAALMAKNGFKAASAIFEGKNGFCDWMGGCNFDMLYGDLGKRFRINEMWLKPYSCMYAFHSALDIAKKLVKEHHVVPEEIKQVNVRSFLRVSQLAQPAHYTPTGLEHAQFSVPFCMGLVITKGKVIPDFLSEKYRRDQKLLQLGAKVKVELDPELDKVTLQRGDMKRPALVQIVTSNGEMYEDRLDYPKGQWPQNPMSDDEVREKFRGLASRLIKEKQIENIIKSVERLEKLQDITGLMKPLATKGEKRAKN
jgi:2-methylcitrate dehydratase